MRHVLLVCLAIAVMVGITAHVSAGEDRPIFDEGALPAAGDPAG